MVHAKYVDIDRMPRLAKAWWYGYTAELATAAGRFVDLLFARGWRSRLAALASRHSARGVVFRRDRI
jgi:hypothetical protein